MSRRLKVNNRRRRRSIRARLAKWLALPLSFFAGSAKADMTVVEAFLAGNDWDCMALTFEGFCLFLVVTVSLTGVDVSIHLTPKISHYNPELLVATTGRINTSPLTDANLLYGTLAREASKPFISLLTGEGGLPPNAYDNVDGAYASRGSTTGTVSPRANNNTKRSYIFSEVDIVGSPGNVLTLYAEGFESLSEAPMNMVEGVQSALTAVQQIPDVIESTSEAIAPTEVDDAERVNDLAESDQYDGWWEDIEVSPTAVATLLLGEDVAGLIEGATGIYDALEPFDFEVDAALLASIEDAEQQINDAVEDVETTLGDINDYLDDSDDVDDLADGAADADLDGSDVTDGIDTLTDEVLSWSVEELADALEESIEDIQAQIDEVLGQVQQLEDILSAMQGGGAGIVIHPWRNFCKRDASVYKPYFLSGLDIIAWRWRLPEMVYPQTYSVPLRSDGEGGFGFFSKSNHVGNFDVSTFDFGEFEFPEWNYWGPIYPRAGGLMQSDMIKARAVAASRAVHVVTRAGEPHIYWPLRVKQHNDWIYDGFKGSVKAPPTEFDPQDGETGLWQLIDAGEHGGGEHSCLRFGEEDALAPVPTFNDDGEIDGVTAGSYPELVDSDDGRLLYNFWRKKVCCEDPDPPNGISIYLEDLDLQIELSEVVG